MAFRWEMGNAYQIKERKRKPKRSALKEAFCLIFHAMKTDVSSEESLLPPLMKRGRKGVYKKK